MASEILKKLTQGELAEGFVEDLLDIIGGYEGAMHVSTVIGCLDLVKQQLIFDHMEGDDDDE